MDKSFEAPPKPEMTVADAATLHALKAASRGAVLKDAEGYVLGEFRPTLEAELKAFGLTVEEMNRRLASPASEWASADEVISRLRSLWDGP